MMKLRDDEKFDIADFVYSNRLGISLYRDNYNFRIDIIKYSHAYNMYHILVYNTQTIPQELYSEFFIYAKTPDELIDFYSS